MAQRGREVNTHGNRELRPLASWSPQISSGTLRALQALLFSPPDVFGHNIETVPRLYGVVRPGADHGGSLALVREVGAQIGVWTKSGLMLGMGETRQEVLAVMVDLRQAGCDLLTIGQYLPPSRVHFPAARFVPPEEFAELAGAARDLGFAAVAAGPLVRSSYRAATLLAQADGGSPRD